MVQIVLAILVLDWTELSLLPHVAVVVACQVMFSILVLTKSRYAWMGFSAVVIMLIKLRWLRGWIVLVLALIAAVIIVKGIGVTETLEVLMTNNTLYK